MDSTDSTEVMIPEALARSVLKIEGTVHKQEPEALVNRQLEVFDAMPSAYRPAGLKRLSPVTYCYKYEDGRTASKDDLSYILLAAADAFWQESLDDVDPNCQWHLYCGYMIRKMVTPELPVTMRNLMIDWLVTAETKIRPCKPVHGDLTFENVIITPAGDVVFIDPGDHRGLSCVELDLSKIAQSLTAHGYPGLIEAMCERMNADVETVLLLEATHWVRLLHHPEKHRDPERLFTFTRERLGALLAPRIERILETKAKAKAKAR